MAKKITNPEVLNLIINSINTGLCDTEIRNDIIHLSRNAIRRIATENGILGILTKNAIRYKSERISKLLSKDRLKFSIELDLIYGNVVVECINAGGILQDIKRIMEDVPSKQVLHFLKYKNLDVKRRENSKKYIAEQSKINGRKAIPITKGIALKSITPQVISRFSELKCELIYKQRVYGALKLEFGFGEQKCKQLCKLYGYPENNPQTGKLNSMYGKSPGKGAGMGVKCWVLFNGIKYFCRSSLELKVMCYLNDNGDKFQISKHRIPYTDDTNVDRTYCPDIVVNNKIYEIKPYNMLKIKLNVLKLEALKNYCEKHGLLYGGYLTEMNVNLTKYDLKYITTLIDAGKIIIDSLNLEKLKRNII